AVLGFPDHVGAVFSALVMLITSVTYLATVQYLGPLRQKESNDEILEKAYRGEVPPEMGLRIIEEHFAIGEGIFAEKTADERQAIREYLGTPLMDAYIKAHNLSRFGQPLVDHRGWLNVVFFSDLLSEVLNELDSPSSCGLFGSVWTYADSEGFVD